MNANGPELVPLDAPTLVEASAGTGKTHAITTYFVRAILELGFAPEQILVVTFTNAATAELRARTRARILEAIALLDPLTERPDTLQQVVANAVAKLGRKEVEQRLRKALREMDQAAIFTIHGFCQRLLQDYPLELGADFEFEVAEDVESVLTDLATDFWMSDLYDKPDWLLRALRSQKIGVDHLVQTAKATMMPGTRILGPEPYAIDETLVTEWLAAHRAAANVWFEDRDDVREILLGDQGLNRTKYPKRSIENRWMAELDAFFAQSEYQPLPEFFARLAQSDIVVRKGCEVPAHRFFDACERLCEAAVAVDAMVRFAVFEFKRRFIEYARAAADRRRSESAIFTFDDLLTAVYEALHRSEGDAWGIAPSRALETVTHSYPVALIDEFQDTDSIQYAIFRAIYGEGRAVYVGDPKQAIYAFRGADVFSYIGAANDVGDRRHTLRTNRRSDPGLVRAVNLLFGRRQRPFELNEIGFDEAIPHENANRSSLEPQLEVVFVPKDQLVGTLPETVAPIVANEIALLLSSGAQVEGRPVELGDVAVLCRANQQAHEVVRALRTLNIPVSLDGGASVLETEIASELRAVLEAALMPGDSRVVRRALLTSVLGVSPYELASMSDEDWSVWASRFAEWHEIWHRHGVVRLVEDVLRATSAELRIASRPSARRDLTDLLHIEELLLRGERERRQSPVALMQWFRRLCDGSLDAGVLGADALQRRPDTELGAVRVSTIHKSKGLEYGIVYCPFTWRDARLGSEQQIVTFHDHDFHLNVDLGSNQLEEHKKAAEREALSEALRLLYVALTRARHRCTLFWGRTKDWNRSALAYLLHGGEAPNKMGEDEMRADVEALANESNQTIGCRPPHEQNATRWADKAPSAALAANPHTRAFSQAGRIASFTSLTGHNEKTPAPRAERPSAAPSAGLFPNLPGGTRTGLLLHSIMESVSFGTLESPDTTGLIERLLRDYGFETSLASEVQRDLGTMCSTPLTIEPDAPRLIDLPPEGQLRELEFTLHVERPSLEDLATLLRTHGAPTAAPGYHARLAEVGAQTLQRFLRGYIDLLFQWEGRWYVADYKSNKLAAYQPADIHEAVQREHYLLQAQLYTAAAQRYLRQRVPDYDVERHWGGALLLFVRGMQGPDCPGCSVFFDRQPAALHEAIDQWLGGAT